MVEIKTNLSSDITAGLDKFAAKVSGDITLSGVAAMANVIYLEVKSNASPPRIGRVTGNLHDAIYRAYSPERSTDTTKIYHVSVNKSKAPHWFMVEHGTSKMAARSYLRKSLDRMQDAIKAGSERMRERLAAG